MSAMKITSMSVEPLLEQFTTAGAETVVYRASVQVEISGVRSYEGAVMLIETGLMGWASNV